MAKKIKLFPVPHVELRIHVSDQMEADLKECRYRAESDCEECSWYGVDLLDTCMCDLPEVVEKVLEEEYEETDE